MPALASSFVHNGCCASVYRLQVLGLILEGLGIEGVCLMVLELATRNDGHEVLRKPLCFQMF